MHGATYFAVLADALAGAGQGDLVLFTDWRGDPDEQLTDDGVDGHRGAGGRRAARRARQGPRVALAPGHRCGSPARRTATCPRASTTSAARCCSTSASARSAATTRSSSSSATRTGRRDDVALLGGIDLAHGRRDDADHRGDPQTLPFAHQYGPRPAWHDVHIQLRGPAVRDVEDVFRERWEDPAALSRLPWQVVPDMLRGEDRQPSRLPPPAPGPARRRHLRGPAPAHLPPAPPRLPVRARRRAQRRPRVRQGAAAGPAPRLRRGPVPVVGRRRAGLRRRAAPRARAAPRRGRPPASPTRTAGSACRPCGSATRRALQIVRAAGGDRVQVLDVENHDGTPSTSTPRSA